MKSRFIKTVKIRVERATVFVRNEVKAIRLKRLNPGRPNCYQTRTASLHDSVNTRCTSLPDNRRQERIKNDTRNKATSPTTTQTKEKLQLRATPQERNLTSLTS
ncbi:hypothetical protein TcasGA2_TC000563 [Tribolium castaneum]|uniref:Uncharacterized protein n=1 Tax=Tribolium castaneum TaxID=7070 RepID=D6W9K5_TRICA|nr:hypothetical protein TcasGA2_TC000563 [Tribolium castaneum]